MEPTRDRILSTLRQALEPLDYVNAMWLGGSSAMGAADDLSDLDLVIDVADSRQEDAFGAAESALERLSPIAYRLIIPEPTWHGHAQRFYRLAGCPEHLLVDFVVMQRTTKAPRFNEREIHGEPVIVFDKLGIVRAVPVDRDAHRQAIRKRLDSLRIRLVLFAHMAGKEVVRGNHLDAVFRYHSFVLQPLISVLRTRYAPFFHDFAPRYLKRDLPPEVYERVMRLSFVASPEALADAIAEARAWAEAELEAIDVDALPLR